MTLVDVQPVPVHHAVQLGGIGRRQPDAAVRRPLAEHAGRAGGMERRAPLKNTACGMGAMSHCREYHMRDVHCGWNVPVCVA